jgi:T4 RnlA family RNA ligase
MQNLMNYYKIPTFEEALAICQKERNFSHSVQEIHGKEVHSFKYQVSEDSMWSDLSDGRINMRGLTFIDEKIVALPYPKFFNINELPITRNLDITKFAYASAKMDGSLISFFKIGSDIEVKTMKSVYSDTAIEAREYLKERPEVKQFAKKCLETNLSPIFEYISNTAIGRIVIDYGKKDFVLLGARDFTSGKIYSVNNFPINIPSEISVVQIFKTKEEIDAYLTDGVEGVVMTFQNGMLAKLKTSWYITLHRFLDIKTKKCMCEYYQKFKSFDDMIGVYYQHGLHNDIERMKDFEKDYWHRYNNILTSAKAIFQIQQGKTRKEIALSMKEDGLDGTTMAIVFKMCDNAPYEFLIEKAVYEAFRKEDQEC